MCVLNFRNFPICYLLDAFVMFHQGLQISMAKESVNKFYFVSNYQTQDIVPIIATTTKTVTTTTNFSFLLKLGLTDFSYKNSRRRCTNLSLHSGMKLSRTPSARNGSSHCCGEVHGS